MTQNVVTYTVAVSTNNDDLKLLPYLTADVDFLVDERHDVLLVPNAALRYRPRKELVIAAPTRSADSSIASGDDEGNDDDLRGVWVKQGNFVYPLEVNIGVTDGSFTEIVGGDLTEGMEVVLSENLNKDQDDDLAESNGPFRSPRFRGKKKKSEKSS